MNVQHNHPQHGDLMERQQVYQRVNFDAWAMKWNENCSKIEKGVIAHEQLTRKTAKQSVTYHE